MATRGRGKDKIGVPEAGQGAALRHNPFAALGPANAQSAPALPEHAEQPHAQPQAHPEPLPKTRGRLILRREKKHRGGKTVVIVAGLRAHAHLAESEIAELAQDLKRQLGCGGAVERVANDSELVLQGDQPARVAELLRASGFRVDGVTS